jgi:hypothetical protein
VRRLAVFVALLALLAGCRAAPDAGPRPAAEPPGPGPAGSEQKRRSAVETSNHKEANTMDPSSRQSSGEAAPSIGRAMMKEDGTIILDLRAEGPGGLKGDARFIYPPTHERYESILKHLGGLEPGETKPVPPWPE